MKNCSVFKAIFIATALVIVASGNAFADRPAKEEYRETVPVKEVPQATTQAIPAQGGCFTRLSAGVPVWMFQDEDNTAAPGVYFDYWCADTPLNFRLGVEGRHLDLGQEEAQSLQHEVGEEPTITYIRIPLAVEYYTELGEGWTGYIGGGPDFLSAVNDMSDTGVGGHLGARLSYAFNENWGVAVEGGYMWAEFSEDDVDVNLDGAYVTPTIHYTF
jgi:hypothetical protein